MMLTTDTVYEAFVKAKQCGHPEPDTLILPADRVRQIQAMVRQMRIYDVLAADETLKAAFCAGYERRRRGPFRKGVMLNAFIAWCWDESARRMKAEAT